VFTTARTSHVVNPVHVLSSHFVKTHLILTSHLSLGLTSAFVYTFHQSLLTMFHTHHTIPILCGVSYGLGVGIAQYKIFLFSTGPGPALGPIQPPMQWVPGVKRLGREAHHSRPSSAKVKNGRAIPPLPHMCSWHSAQIIYLFTLHVAFCNNFRRSFLS
jgi:hypothetical protein